jgi:type IV pilus assembly protein PilE
MLEPQRGVTLIELMTVVVVLAILASIAVPAYRSYLLRSHRTDATIALLRIQAAQEKFFLQNMRYADDLTAAPPGGLGASAVSDEGRYDLILERRGANGYRARAVPRPGGGQTDDTKCTELSIDEAGVRDAAGAASNPRAECWR